MSPLAGAVALHVAGRIRSKELLQVFAGPVVKHDVQEQVRSGNGPKIGAEKLREWLEHMGTRTACLGLGTGVECECAGAPAWVITYSYDTRHRLRTAHG